METLLKIIYIFLIIFSLLRVLFITLLERKYLGIINNRKGPNHYLINSLFQSLIDFIKLLFKKNIKLNFTLRFLWNIIIFYGLLIFLLLMLNFPLMNRINFFYLNFFFFFFVYSLISFFFLILSFRSNRIYSIISIYRVLIQVLSYEVGMIFLFFIPLIIMNLFNYYIFFDYNFILLLFLSNYLIILLIIRLREINRTPFDFLESETELVSGFNVEYLARLFSIIFLIEYGFFIYYILLLVLIMNFNLIFILILSIMIIWIRSFLPRYRYDKIIYFFWKDLLFIVFSFYCFLLFF